MPINLRRFDLNLLVVLQTLMEERNVTRAACRLNLSQPALSHALARLREAVGDPLLVRHQGRMVPTPLALRLQIPLQEVLGRLGGLLAVHDEVDPVNISETFRMGLSGYSEFILMSPLSRHFLEVSPRLQCVVRPLDLERFSEHLAEGTIDVAAGYVSAVDHPELLEEVLLEDRYVCIAQGGRGGFRGRLTMERYLALPHVLIAQSGAPAGTPDQILASQGLRRHIAVATLHYHTAAQMVAETDLLLTTSRLVARKLCESLPLRLLDPPFQLPPIVLRQIWHMRTHADPVHQWLRDCVRAAARAAD